MMILRRCFSPSGTIRRKHSSRMERTNLGSKLVLDELGQAAVLLDSLSELGPVLRHALVKCGLFRPPAHILVVALDSARLSEGGWSLLRRDRLHGADPSERRAGGPDGGSRCGSARISGLR